MQAHEDADPFIAFAVGRGVVDPMANNMPALDTDAQRAYADWYLRQSRVAYQQHSPYRVLPPGANPLHHHATGRDIDRQQRSNQGSQPRNATQRRRAPERPLQPVRPVATSRRYTNGTSPRIVSNGQPASAGSDSSRYRRRASADQQQSTSPSRRHTSRTRPRSSTGVRRSGGGGRSHLSSAAAARQVRDAYTGPATVRTLRARSAGASAAAAARRRAAPAAALDSEELLPQGVGPELLMLTSFVVQTPERMAQYLAFSHRMRDSLSSLDSSLRRRRSGQASVVWGRSFNQSLDEYEALMTRARVAMDGRESFAREAAATRVQASYRGHAARKELHAISQLPPPEEQAAVRHAQ